MVRGVDTRILRRARAAANAAAAKILIVEKRVR